MKRARISRWGGLASAGLAVALYAVPAAAQNVISTQQNPNVTFSTPGLKSVTLQACNVRGCTSVIKTVLVLNPLPAVTAASALPLIVEAGQLVRLTGAGTGQPALNYTWKLLAGGIAEVASLGGATAWWDTIGMAPGAYTAVLQIQNASGIALSLPIPIVVNPSLGLAFYTINPCRVFDSRASAPLSSGVPRVINAVGSGCGIPAGARALALNVTVVGPSGTGYVALYPGNYPQPATSTINFAAGAVRANHSVLPIATDGTGTLAAVAMIPGNGVTHLVVDASGYFLP